MSDRDVVAELDAWLPGGVGHRGSYDDLRAVVQRARDKLVAQEGVIAALRTALHESLWLIRAEALEQAARVCDELGEQMACERDIPGGIALSFDLAAAVRALKDKGDG